MGLLISISAQGVRFVFASREDRSRVEPQVLALPSSELTASEWFEHRQALEEEEDLEGAEKAYLKAVALQPQFPEAHFNLGKVLREQDRLGVAEQAYQTYVAQDLAFAAGWYNLADVQDSRGNTEEAIRSLIKAVDIAPSFAEPISIWQPAWKKPAAGKKPTSTGMHISDWIQTVNGPRLCDNDLRQGDRKGEDYLD